MLSAVPRYPLRFQARPTLTFSLVRRMMEMRGLVCFGSEVVLLRSFSWLVFSIELFINSNILGRVPAKVLMTVCEF